MMGAPLGPRQRNCSPSCQMRVYCSARRMAAGRWVRAPTNGHPAGRGAGLSPAARRSGEASTVLVRPSPHRQQRGGDDRQQSRAPAPRRWSDLPGCRLVEGEQGSGLGLGEVTGAAPLTPQVAPCGLRRAQVVAGRGPGVEEHQAAHQAPGPAPCGCRSRRPSRRRFGSVLLCAEGAVTWHVDVVGFAGHCRSSALLVDVVERRRQVGVSTPGLHRTTVLGIQLHAGGVTIRTLMKSGRQPPGGSDPTIPPGDGTAPGPASGRRCTTCCARPASRTGSAPREMGPTCEPSTGDGPSSVDGPGVSLSSRAERGSGRRDFRYRCAWNQGRPSGVAGC
jgi:hypothetical protein